MGYEHRFVKNNKTGKVDACWNPASRCYEMYVTIKKQAGDDALWGPSYRFTYDNIGDIHYYLDSIGIALPQDLIQALLKDRITDERQHREVARSTPITTLRVTASGITFD